MANENIDFIHPCDAWAKSAGLDSWDSAVISMKKVFC